MESELKKTIEELKNTHHGTCDSCGAITFVTRWKMRGFEYLCDECLLTIAEARRQIRKEYLRKKRGLTKSEE